MQCSLPGSKMYKQSSISVEYDCRLSFRIEVLIYSSLFHLAKLTMHDNILDINVKNSL